MNIENMTLSDYMGDWSVESEAPSGANYYDYNYVHSSNKESSLGNTILKLLLFLAIGCIIFLVGFHWDTIKKRLNSFMEAEENKVIEEINK
ncbi:hypothetical protein [Emticicia agri]|uniref:hypothetical protein n=1 Tax=Emticicia agri TaxID=2492393 RepID=UPI0013ED9F84|nr:hypothetical protein [Emticicia agri]